MMRSVQPARAAKIFNMYEEAFTEITEPVDVLLGHIRPAIFPEHVKTVSESSLWRTIFGSGFFALSAETE